MTVAVLCAARNSVYHTLAGVDVYDIDRDARSYRGTDPVVAHPPCRSWSATCGHQSKAPPEERELALWCCEVLKKNGGVLEQPAHSRLFDAAGLPLPGESGDELWSQQVWQNWWGYGVKKKTWLCFSRINPYQVELPFRLNNSRGCLRKWNKLSKHQRAATCPEPGEVAD